MPQEFPRIYAEFIDPAGQERLYRCDLTWLTSHWQCIYGRGCQGIFASRPDDGCCTLGAHLSDDRDVERVSAAASRLTPEQWQGWSLGQDGSWLVADADSGDRKTAVVDDACVFLNRPGFPGGAGCALHVLADAEKVSVIDTKPDVCWSLPIRRTFRRLTEADGSTIIEVTITEFTRRAWGQGGAFLHWFCSSNTDAHTAAAPVYQTCAAELTAMMGGEAYALLVDVCRRFEAGASLDLAHPADSRSPARLGVAVHDESDGRRDD